jgi:Ca2+ transporting ATPase
LDLGGVKGLEDRLNTNSKVISLLIQSGISEDSAETKARVEAYGINQPILKTPKSFCQMVLDNFKDTTLQILSAAAIVSLIMGIYTQGWKLGWLEGLSIIIAVLIIVSVTTINNYFKEQQFLKLNAMAKQKNVNVYRNGVLANISVYELMVGDLVEVETGEILSVDGLIIRGTEVMADESAITGESIEIRKKPFTEKEHNNPFLVSGSKVVDGNCTIFVMAVGSNSQDGKLKAKIQQDQEETPLQHKL